MAKNTRKILLILGIIALIGSGYGSLSKSSLDRKQGASPVEKAVLSNLRTEIVRREDGLLVLDIECPGIRIDLDSVSGRVWGIDIAGATPQFEIGVPRLPVITRLLDCLPGRVAVEIEDIESDDRSLGAMMGMAPDVQVDPRPTNDGETDHGGGSLDSDESTLSWRDRCEMISLKQGFWPPQVAAVQDAGVYRGHRMVALNVNPVQVDASRGLARVIRRVRLRITMPRMETAQNRIPDRPAETETIRSLLGPLKETALPTRMTEAFTGGHHASGQLDETVGGRWKLIVKNAGIIRVTGADLRTANCPVDQISTYDTHIKNRGREIPIHFSGETDGHFDDNDYIEFYGEENVNTFSSNPPALYRDPYSDENVYWLSWGDGRHGMRLGQEDGAYRTGWRARTVNSVRQTVHFEGDYRFERLSSSSLEWANRVSAEGPLAVYEDHWFWGDAIDAYTTRDYPVRLYFPDPRSTGGVILRAALQGLTERGAPDALGIQRAGQHRAVLRLNGETAPGLSIGRTSPNDGNTPWIGQAPVIIQNTIPATGLPEITSSELIPGMNSISVFAPGDGLAGAIDKFYANWFEIEYDRELRATTPGGFIHFRFDQNRADTFSFEIRRFSSDDIQVWKLGRSRLTNLTKQYVRPADESASWAVRFQLISDDAYDVLAFDDRFPKPPYAILPEKGTRDLRAMTGSEYLLIYHDSFAQDLSLLRLDSLRRASFNGSADTISVTEIYEQFGDGIAKPEAIRDFLKYAYENWTIRPTHACLVGDGMIYWRTRNNVGNLISSFYPATYAYGVSASDMLLGCVSGPPWDLVPDIAVGRISCRTSAELQTYVEKVLRYEDPQQSAYNSLFHSTVLFVSDGADGQFNFDRNFSEPTINLMAPEIVVNRVFLDSIPGSEAQNALRDAFRQGAVIVNYNGHGGGGVWSGDKLIDVSGVRLLNNRRQYPLITSFTCYVGNFDDQDQSKVLGEAFLFSRNSRGDPVGAIGAFSSSGVGWALAGVSMQSYLYDFVVSTPGLTQGEIVLMNKARYWSGQASATINLDNYYSQNLMMCLLGDPGVKLQIPQQQWRDFRSDTNIVANGDTMLISGNLPWDPVGVVDLYLLPFNGESHTYSLRWGWDPALQESTWISIPMFRSSKVPAYNPEEVVSFPITERRFENVPLRISNLTTPQGNVVIYAVDQGRAPSGSDPGVPPRDAIGSLPIFFADSLSAMRIFDVEVLPDKYIYNDSTFQVQARIAHQSGIEHVDFRGIFRPAQGPVLLDTVAMFQVVPGLWQTPVIGPHDVLGGQYRAQFFVKPFGESVVTSGNFTLNIEGTSDWFIQTTLGFSPRLAAGAEPVYVVPVAHQKNPSARLVSRLTVEVFAVAWDTLVIQQPPRPDSVVITAKDSFRTRIDVPQPWQLNSVFEARVPAAFRPMKYMLTARLDPDNEIPEWFETNNIYSTTLQNIRIFPATQARGSFLPRTPDETTSHTILTSGIADTLWLRLDAGSLPVDSTSLIYSGPTLLSDAERQMLNGSGVRPPVPNDSVYYYRVMMADSGEMLGPSPRVTVTKSFRAYVIAGSLSEAIDHIQLFHHTAASPYWKRLPATQIAVFDVDTTYTLDTSGTFTEFDTTLIIKGRAEALSQELGYFSLFVFEDAAGPSIELAVDGMKFTPHSLLPRQPAIYATLTDYSGVDRSPGKFTIFIDSDTIPYSAFAWSDTLGTMSAVTALFRPELDPGHHVIRVKATDNNGLVDSLTAEFDVRGSFGFEWAINYPNPFSRTTTISYVLSDATSEAVEVKIYTVSGRHIRTLRESLQNVANYREIIWDGTDRKGEEVANGVYFAKIIAKRGDEKIEKIVKLAKAR